MSALNCSKKTSESPGHPTPILNVAALCTGTHALGPGLRSVVWTQGCVFNCPGCISPEWIEDKPAHLMTPEQVVDTLLDHPSVTGLTFSGGEPFFQSRGLAEVARLARRRRDLDILCFTGYRLEQLRQNPPNPWTDMLLSQIDALVDGPYIAAMNDNKGLRGSSNQNIHYLTPRLSTYFLEEIPRRVEIQVQEGLAFLVGVPPKGTGSAFSSALHHFRIQQFRLVQDERA